MTTFVLLAALMAIAGVALLARPLYRARSGEGRAALGLVALVAVAVPLASFVLYDRWSNWSWDPATRAQAEAGAHTAAASLEQSLARLEARLQAQPDDVEGWVMLGRTYAVTNQPDRAIRAFERAHELTGGRDADVLVGLAESLTLVDEKAIDGRAGELFESAWKLDPQNPRALWYSGVAALRAGRTEVARDRWAALVATDPPPEVKAILDERVAELDRQLGRPVATPARASATPASAPATSVAAAVERPLPKAVPGQVTVRVKLAPELAGQAPRGAPMFVLARDAARPGPPIAARRVAGESFPVDIVLREDDAMMAGSTLAGASQLVIVARISRSGLPTAASGDLYGEVRYDLAAGKPVDLLIDRTVP